VRDLLRVSLLLGACCAQPAGQPEVVQTAGAESQHDACTAPRKASRVYVGFSEGMTLADFELAAFEAERITAALLRLCEPDKRATDSHLRDALATGALEITAIDFLRDDAGAAHVRLRRPEPFADSERWRLELTRAPAGWLLLSAARE
jgi:hypothetical protein